jgi:predicted Zn-dependent peptidase
MKNIREEKGLTYGIYSSVASMIRDSYLVIGADVNKENRELTVEEIKKEMQVLRTKAIESTEFETARNHFIGSLQSEITTPFAHADKIKNIILNKLPSDYYQALLHRIDSLSSADLLATAQKYFHEDSFFEVTVG